MKPQAPSCPQCGSKRVWKDGLRHLADGSIVQRWLCRDCGYRFSDPAKTSKRKNLHNFYCRVGGWDDQPKNSAKAVKALKELEEAERRAAGATKKSLKAEIKGDIIEFLWWMKKRGYSEETIVSKGQILRRLTKLGADLFDPESVSDVIAKQKNWSPGRKAQVVYAYALFAKWTGIEWNPPRISIPEKLPFIPLEREIDDLIAGCTKHIAVALQIAKETGARVGEIFRLRWSDVDFESRTIRITPEKSGKARIFRMSNKLIQMLNALPKETERVLSRYKNVRSLRRTFEKQRKKVAFKLGNPRLLRITFHTIRHWKATMEYYRTKDILHVMQVLGHKNIKNTLIYTHLVKNLGQEEDEYVSKVARNVEEVRSLVEAGFEYVCEVDGFKVFRKRK